MAIDCPLGTLSFGEQVFLDTAGLWVELVAEQKQRLQNAHLPKGLSFCSGIIGTAETRVVHLQIPDGNLEKASLATLPGIEPRLPFHKADTLKPLQT